MPISAWSAISPTVNSGFAPVMGQPRVPSLSNGLIGGWSPGLGPTGSGIEDYSGLNNQGTLTNDVNTGWVTDRYGYALDFDGTDDYASIPARGYLDFGADDFTVAWWEYRRSNANAKSALVRDNSLNFPPFLIGFSGATTNLQVYMSSTGVSWDIASARTLGPVTLDSWHHYAVTRNNNNFNAYKDGVRTDTWGSTLALLASSSPLEFGRYNAGTNVFFDGLLDDIRFYELGLDINTVSQLAQRPNIAYEWQQSIPFNTTEAITGFQPAVHRNANQLIQSPIVS